MIKKVQRPDASDAREYLEGFIVQHNGKATKAKPVDRAQEEVIYNELEIYVSSLPVGERKPMINQLEKIGYVDLNCMNPVLRLNPIPEDPQDQSHTQQREP
jgi:hypothetical protein